MTKKKKIKTVTELIKELKKWPKNMEVRGAEGGSCNWPSINFVGEELVEGGKWVLVIGRLSW
jgi:hypothetical protein